MTPFVRGEDILTSPSPKAECGGSRVTLTGSAYCDLFRLIGTREFSGRGRVGTAQPGGSHFRWQLNTVGPGGADSTIALQGSFTLAEPDYALEEAPAKTPQPTAERLDKVRALVVAADM